MSTSSHRFGTKAVHAGQKPDPSTGAIMPAIYQTSTFVQKAPGEHLGYEYARVHNPTRTALEGNLAALENANSAICFASGVAATDAIIKSMAPGDHVLSTNDLYGGTYRLFEQTYRRFGLDFTFIDMQDSARIEASLKPNTKLIWIETPTNPLIRIIDIKEVCDIARSRGIDVVVDNTFASPFLQRPLDLGATMVVHSTTKYLGGHSDVIGGAVCTSHPDWTERLRFQIKSAGAAPGPMDCFLTLRGTKTLHLRMERHCANAGQIAQYLFDHPKIAKVYYPGLESHDGHGIAKKQMDGFGGMLSFELKDRNFESARRVMSGMKVFSLAESLGGVESLVNHPASMTHASIPKEERLKTGLTDTLIRLSVGIEDITDLINDLDQVLSTVY